MNKQEQILNEFYRNYLRDWEDVVDNSTPTIAKIVGCSIPYANNVIEADLSRKINILNGTTEPKEKQTKSSQYKGVSWDRVANKWRAQYPIGRGNNKYLGLFNKEVDASDAYIRYKNEYYQ